MQRKVLQRIEFSTAKTEFSTAETELSTAERKSAPPCGGPFQAIPENPNRVVIDYLLRWKKSRIFSQRPKMTENFFPVGRKN